MGAGYPPSKDQDVKASKVRVRTVRCRRLMVNKNEALEAVADKVEDDIDPNLMDEPKSKTTALLKNSTQERPYGPHAKDPETIPESDEPKFIPGVKVLIQSPKTKHWDQSAIVINWRHGRTYVLDDGTQRFTRWALWSNERRNKNHFITDPDAPNAGKDAPDAEDH